MILASDGFEKSELFTPLERLEEEGAEVHIVSDKEGKIKSWDEKDWGTSIAVNKTLQECNFTDYDALVLPGGVINPDTLRTNELVLSCVRSFKNQGKPVAAICHAPWLLVSAGIIKDCQVTSYVSIKDDVINAGGQWIDEAVVCDNGIITSRNPQDLPHFCEKIIEEIQANTTVLA